MTKLGRLLCLHEDVQTFQPGVSVTSTASYAVWELITTAFESPIKATLEALPSVQ